MLPNSMVVVDKLTVEIMGVESEVAPNNVLATKLFVLIDVAAKNVLATMVFVLSDVAANIVFATIVVVERADVETNVGANNVLVTKLLVLILLVLKGTRTFMVAPGRTPLTLNVFVETFKMFDEIVTI